jgi:hypothetical protein
MGSRDSSVSVVIRRNLDDLGFESWQRQEIYLIFRMSRLALIPTQAPIQWILGLLPGGVVRA